MADSTPTKNVTIDCFICFAKDVTCFKLSGRKCMKEKFMDNLNRIIGDHLCQELFKRDAMVCRNCYSRVINVCDFIQKCEHSTQSYLNTTICKRGALSPLTPRSSSRVQLPVLPVCKSRKMLKLENNATISEKKSTIDEHDYVSKCISAQTDTKNNEVLEVLCDVYSELKQKGGEAVCDLRSQCQSLTSRAAMFSSVLLKYRGMTDLIENSENLLQDIILEMRKRVPLLLEVLCCAAVPANGKVTPSLIPILAACYGILMKHRFHNLSAFQRLTTAIAIKGGLDDRAQTRLNHLGLTLSTSNRIRFQESVHECSLKLITESLKSNPLIKITGDNLDIYVKTSHLTSEKRNQDLHLFTSNIIFSRIATVDMSITKPNVDVNKLTADDVLLTPGSLQQERLMYAYSILLARILCKLPAFQCYKKLIPDHMPHEYSKKMETKSLVYPLPIQFRNEAKHEDCLCIMDTYEEHLIKTFTEAFGNTDVLRKFGVPVGGDQLTRVRLQEAYQMLVCNS